MYQLSRFLLLLSLATSAAWAQDSSRTARSVAFTFDDLPVVRSSSLADAQAITDRLLTAISEQRIPAIGFVNEGKLEQPAGEEAERTALLEQWLDVGLDLGNHTYSHMRLYDVTVDRFLRDVRLGERVTRRIMRERGRQPRWFRHPTLNTGRDLPTKNAVERALIHAGYTVAPVTIDNDEYLYALAYDRARERGDSAAMRRLGADYVRYMGEIFAHYERLSRDLLGREPAQTLLLHANALNADWLGPLAGMIAARGYRFVPLEEAMSDPAYALPDTYTGARGPSWLERWAVTRGMRPGRPPEVPDWVTAAAR